MGMQGLMCGNACRILHAARGTHPRGRSHSDVHCVAEPNSAEARYILFVCAASVRSAGGTWIDPVPQPPPPTPPTPSTPDGEHHQMLVARGAPTRSKVQVVIRQPFERAILVCNVIQRPVFRKRRNSVHRNCSSDDICTWNRSTSLPLAGSTTHD